jgi:hypothetical protein
MWIISQSQILDFFLSLLFSFLVYCICFIGSTNSIWRLNSIWKNKHTNCPILESLVNLVYEYIYIYIYIKHARHSKRWFHSFYPYLLVGIYRNSQQTELLQTFSPKIKTLYDIFQHGKYEKKKDGLLLLLRQRRGMRRCGKAYNLRRDAQLISILFCVRLQTIQRPPLFGSSSSYCLW